MGGEGEREREREGERERERGRESMKVAISDIAGLLDLQRETNKPP